MRRLKLGLRLGRVQMKKGKVARPSGLMSVVKPAGKAGIDITNLINQIIVEGLIPTE